MKDLISYKLTTTTLCGCKTIVLIDYSSGSIEKEETICDEHQKEGSSNITVEINGLYNIHTTIKK